MEFRGLPVALDRHALDGAAAEGLTVDDILDTMEDGDETSRSRRRVQVERRRGRKAIIVRYSVGPDEVYVFSVSQRAL
jgi:hypothetical protein